MTWPLPRTWAVSTSQPASAGRSDAASRGCGNSGRRLIDKGTALGAAQGAMLWCLAMVMESHQAA